MGAKSRELRRRKAELGRASAELTDIRSQLGRAYALFDMSSDPGLTEAYIFEINALRVRYDHAVKGLKALY